MSGSDHPGTLRNVTAAMLALSWIAVMFRVYVRAWMIKAFGADDCFSVATLVIFTLHCCFIFVGLEYRIDTSETPEQALIDSVSALKWYWCAILPYITSSALIKVTVGLFILRFCRSKTHIRVIYFTLGLIITYDLAYLLVCTFECTPVKFFWLELVGEKGSCIDRQVLTDLSFIAAGLNTAADIVLGVLPVVIVMGLQLDIRTKIGVASVLAVGSISCISTIIRIPYIVFFENPASDFAAATTPVALWGVIEIGLGLIASSLVTLKPLFKRWFKEGNLYNFKLKGDGYTSSHKAKNSSSLGNKRGQGQELRSESEVGLALDELDVDGKHVQR